MSITSIQFVILGISAFVLAGLLTWPVRALAIKLSVMDLPNMERKTQKEPVPYLGGVAIALSIIIVTYGAIYYSDNTRTNLKENHAILFIQTHCDNRRHHRFFIYCRLR